MKGRFFATLCFLSTKMLAAEMPIDCNEILRLSVYNTNFAHEKVSAAQASHFVESSTYNEFSSYERLIANALCEEAAEKGASEMSAQGKASYAMVFKSGGEYSRADFKEWHRQHCDQNSYAAARSDALHGKRYDSARSKKQYDGEVASYAHNLSKEALNAWSACVVSQGSLTSLRVWLHSYDPNSSHFIARASWRNPLGAKLARIQVTAKNCVIENSLPDEMHGGQFNILVERGLSEGDSSLVVKGVAEVNGYRTEWSDSLTVMTPIYKAHYFSNKSALSEDSAHPRPGGCYTLIHKESGLALDGRYCYRNLDDGDLYIHTPNHSDHQKWTLVQREDGYYALRHKQTGHSLDGRGRDQSSYLHEFHGNFYQQWLLQEVSGGAFQLIHRESGLALDARELHDRPGVGEVYLREGNDDDRQRWQLKPIQ